MSNSAKPLVSSLRVYPYGNHALIKVWIRGSRAGALVMDMEDAIQLCSRLLPSDCYKREIPRAGGGFRDEAEHLLLVHPELRGQI